MIVQTDPRAPRVVLVGPPGAGKSTIGRKLAKELGVELYDTDAGIERETGRTIPEIFAADGEPEFRRIEERVVRRAILAERGVVSLGGGAVLSKDTRALLRNRTVVYLEISVAEGLRRTGASNQRPLLNGDDPGAKYRELMRKRRPLYREVATVRVRTDGRSPGRVVRMILDKLGIEPVTPSADPEPEAPAANPGADRTPEGQGNSRSRARRRARARAAARRASAKENGASEKENGENAQAAGARSDASTTATAAEGTASSARRRPRRRRSSARTPSAEPNRAAATAPVSETRTWLPRLVTSSARSDETGATPASGRARRPRACRPAGAPNPGGAAKAAVPLAGQDDSANPAPKYAASATDKPATGRDRPGRRAASPAPTESSTHPAAAESATKTTSSGRARRARARRARGRALEQPARTESEQ